MSFFDKIMNERDEWKRKYEQEKIRRIAAEKFINSVECDYPEILQEKLYIKWKQSVKAMEGKC